MNNTEDLNQWLSHIYTYRIPVFRQLKSFIDFVGIGAELGAGSCWFSSLLSRSDRITNITVIDINKDRLDLAKSFFIPKFKGNIEKIYTKDEWNNYFSGAGFALEFHEYFLDHPLKEKIVKRLKKWNGILFNRCFFIARPHY